MLQNTVSIQLNNQESANFEKILSSNGWVCSDISNEYVSLRMKNNAGSVGTLYKSNKLVFQGNEDFTKILMLLKKTSNTEKNVSIVPHIGVDEVGKGDYFGPLIVVGCFVDRNFWEKISVLGIVDSKKLSDKKILSLYDKLKDYEYYYSSIVYPEEYNRLVGETGNVAILLARQHSKVIEMGLEDLKSKNIKCEKVVIDQFSNSKSRVTNELGVLGKQTNFVQFHKGESDSAVACASVIARGIFLNEMEKMKDEYYFNFPKGASNVIPQARDFVRMHGEDELRKVAKVSFKTTSKVLSSSF